MPQAPSPARIRVQDVARRGVYEFGPEEPVMRGPYDLFHPAGAVHRRGPLVEWREGDQPRTARVVGSTLGTTHPGERVLVRLPPRADDDEWWLCEVQSVDGVPGT